MFQGGKQTYERVVPEPRGGQARPFFFQKALELKQELNIQKIKTNSVENGVFWAVTPCDHTA
jgi:hypothetical protein